ncbi:MAG: NAD(P)-binding domain-containing protein [Synergistaceae bacterium]|nr:NAD(P)-binding domain-containing protein [Synergistaceae bacterium]
MKIGFIGLGIMGRPMAKNLLKAGHELVVFDRSLEPVEDVVKFGNGKAVKADKIQDVAKGFNYAAELAACKERYA